MLIRLKSMQLFIYFSNRSLFFYSSLGGSRHMHFQVNSNLKRHVSGSAQMSLAPEGHSHKPATVLCS